MSASKSCFSPRTYSKISSKTLFNNVILEDDELELLPVELDTELDFEDCFESFIVESVFISPSSFSLFLP